MDRMDRGVAFSSWRSRFERVSGATLALVVTGTLGRVITLLTQMVIAREFGVSMFSDAYFAMAIVPELFVSFIAVGFSTIFIPMFAEYRITQGEHEAWRFASSFLFLSTIVSLFLAAVTAVCSPFLVSVLTPGFHGPARQIAVTLLRIMAFSIIFLGLDAGMFGLLNSHREFIIPEFARVTYNCVLLGVAWTLSSRFGVSVLAWGTVLAGVIRMTIQFLGAAKQGVLKLVWAFDHPGTRRAAKQLIPFVIAISGVEIIFVLDRMVASGLSEGSIAALNYASRIILLPIGIFALPLRTTLYPTLSDFAAQSRLHELAETTLSGLKVLLFIIIPACVGLAALRVPLTRLLFERGAFDRLATLATGEALICYASGVPAFAAIFFLNNAYFSLGDPSTLVKLNIVGWSTNLFLNLILSRYLGHQGIALATSISATLIVTLMIFFLKQDKLKSLSVKSLLDSVYKTVFVSALMGLPLLLLPDKLNSVLIQLQLDYQFLQVAILISIGASTYLIAARLLRIDELIMLTTAFRKLFRVRCL
jgi:putative peptidoglycan lipid II flippase